ncbi:MAG: hypothetical protein ACT4O1_15270 [Gemmatimonadota bacterium]
MIAKRTALILAVALSPAAVEPADAQRAKQLPPGCASVAALQDTFQILTAELNLNRQVIANFGFDRSIAQFERAAALPQAQVLESTKAVQKLLFDESMRNARAQFASQAQSGAVDLATTGASEGARVIGSQLSPEAIAAFRKLGYGNPELVRRVTIANDVSAALEILDKAKAGYSLADDVSKRQLLQAGYTLLHDLAVKQATAAGVKAGVFGPASAGWVGLIVSANEWAWLLAYESADAVWTVRRLNQATAGELKLLTLRADSSKKLVTKLAKVRAELAQLARTCDSSKLAKKKSPFGKGTAILLGAGTATLGAVAAASLLVEQPGTSGSSNSCISSRSCIVSVFGGQCSCAGSAFGRCDFSGTPGEVGDFCGSGTPCGEGLSCNNGRCEGRNGRCPF